MSHTPGPWVIHGLNSTSDINGPVNPVRVAKFWPGPGAYEVVADCSHAVTGSASGEANARLIAAAPEMIEALKSAERVLQAQVRCEFNAGAPPTGTYHHTKLLEIQAAIAKAEGKLAL